MKALIPTRRAFGGMLLSGGALKFLSEPGEAQQEYPSRPINVVIGFPAGSGADTVTRFFAAEISKLAGQPLLVENKPGAFSSLALAHVGRAKPDGYTILWTGSSIMAGGQHLIRKMPNDTQKDFTPVAAFADFPFVLAVGTTSRATDLKSLVELLKAKERPLYGHFNPPAYLATAHFNSQLGIRATPVAYRGAADALPDVENGTLDFMIMDGAFAVGPVRAGRIRALAVTSPVRAPGLPNVPTIAEAGYGNFEVTPWWGAWFPAGVPQFVVNKFFSWFVDVARQPETAHYLEKLAVVPVAGDAAEVTKRIKADANMWNSLAKQIGLTPQ